MKNDTGDIYSDLFFNHPVPMLMLDTNSYKICEINIAAEKLYNYSRSAFLQLSFSDLFINDDYARFLKMQLIHSKKPQPHQNTWINRKKNGSDFFAEINLHEVKHDKNFIQLASVKNATKPASDRPESNQINDTYQFLTEETFDAIWDWDLITGKLRWNDSAKKMFEITNAQVLEQHGWWSKHLHPEDKKRVEKKLKQHLEECIAHWQDEYRFKTSENNYKYIADRGYIICDGNNKPVRMIGAMQDITGPKAYEAQLQTLNSSLEKRAKELAESNEELERFAYVASHDLQEPLRMVTSFLQLIEKKYKDKLDKKAIEYIRYAVDGAERMKKLILDLLEYSRVNTDATEKGEVDMNNVLKEIRLTYHNIMTQTGGSITSGPLPVLKGNRTQLLQLFQNLVGNAFKYRSTKQPEIKISCEEENTFYKFAITDNGIGIDSKFFGKIFIIFQRLHTREQYSGTGIGLAICKKLLINMAVNYGYLPPWVMGVLFI